MPRGGDDPRHRIHVFRPAEAVDRRVPIVRGRRSRGAGVEIWTRSGEAIVGGADDEALSKLAQAGIVPLVQVPDSGQSMFLLHHEDGMTAPPNQGATIRPLQPVDRPLPLPGGNASHTSVRQTSRRVHGHPAYPGRADGAARRGPRPAALSPSVVNPLVTQIVNGTSQSNWFQYVKDLSGENPTLVGGVMRTINSRYSDAMFPTPRPTPTRPSIFSRRGRVGATPGCAKATPPRTRAARVRRRSPGRTSCSPIPGQVDFGQHQQVILRHALRLAVVLGRREHRPTRPARTTRCPAARRCSRRCASSRTTGSGTRVKIIFFSGEEQGLCGSKAYVTQHPTADMWRVVNMDQTAYDGNLNSLMDCYNWSIVELAGRALRSGMRSSRPTSTTARSSPCEHRSGHDPHVPDGPLPLLGRGGRGDRDLTEDLHNNDICPCFDQTPDRDLPRHRDADRSEPLAATDVQSGLLLADARRPRSRSWRRSPIRSMRAWPRHRRRARRHRGITART